MRAAPASPDPTRCPLCGETNRCGVAAGQTSCWCMQVTIPGELLQRLPAEAQGKACVCQACVDAFAAGTLDARLEARGR